MSFPDLQPVPDQLKGGGVDFPYSAEATGIPSSGNNVINLPWVSMGIPLDVILNGVLRIWVDPDPARSAGGSVAPGVTDCRFVSLSPDKTQLTLDFAQSGVGVARVVAYLSHTIVGVGTITPMVTMSTPGVGAAPGAISVSLAKVGALNYEIGAPATNPQFNMSEAGVTPPITVRTLSDDDGNPSQNVLGLPNPLTMPFTYNKSTILDDVIFTGAATDSAPSSSSAAVTLTWLPRIWYGLNPSPLVTTEAQIEALANSALQSDRGLTYNVVGAVNDYVYIAWPQVYGAFNPLAFSVGGFVGGFIDQLGGGTVNLTANTVGAPTNPYILARSTNPLTGNFNVVLAP